MDHLSIPTFFIDMWKWWEYEEYIKRLNMKLEKEEKQNSETEKNQPKMPDYSRKMPNIDPMMRSINKYK